MSVSISSDAPLVFVAHERVRHGVEAELGDDQGGEPSDPRVAPAPGQANPARVPQVLADGQPAKLSSY